MHSPWIRFQFRPNVSTILSRTGSLFEVKVIKVQLDVFLMSARLPLRSGSSERSLGAVGAEFLGPWNILSGLGVYPYLQVIFIQKIPKCIVMFVCVMGPVVLSVALCHFAKTWLHPAPRPCACILCFSFFVAHLEASQTILAICIIVSRPFRRVLVFKTYMVL